MNASDVCLKVSIILAGISVVLGIASLLILFS